MDRPSHPHVVRTWAVDRIRTHAPAPGGQSRPVPDKTKRRRADKDAARRKP